MEAILIECNLTKRIPVLLFLIYIIHGLIAIFSAWIAIKTTVELLRNIDLKTFFTFSIIKVFWYIYFVAAICFVLTALSTIWTFIYAKIKRIPKRIKVPFRPVFNFIDTLKQTRGIKRWLLLFAYGVVMLLATERFIIGVVVIGFIKQCIEDTGAGPLILMLVGPIIIAIGILIAIAAVIAVLVMLIAWPVSLKMLDYIKYVLTYSDTN